MCTKYLHIVLFQRCLCFDSIFRNNPALQGWQESAKGEGSDRREHRGRRHQTERLG